MNFSRTLNPGEAKAILQSNHPELDQDVVISIVNNDFNPILDHNVDSSKILPAAQNGIAKSLFQTSKDLKDNPDEHRVATSTLTLFQNHYSTIQAAKYTIDDDNPYQLNQKDKN